MNDTSEFIEFNGNLGSYTPVRTEDGSFTLKSEAFDENCHSTTGAREETLYNYVHGCQVIEKAAKGEPVTIFETGFGVGLGPLLTFESLKSEHPEAPVTFISTELDEALVKWVIEHQRETPDGFPKWKDLQKIDGNFPRYQASTNNKTLIILLGDARESVNFIQENRLNVIYQDPFSPGKNPSLWTREWFEELIKRCDSNVVMSTYSASQRVRKAMQEAGFTVFNRKGFGPKKSCTVATKGIKFKDLEEVLLSDKINGLTDSEL